MTEREALKLALEALKQIDAAMPFPVAKLAIMEAEKALAQPEQEQQIETLKRCLFQMQEAAKDLVEQAKSLTPPQRTWVGLTPDDFRQLEKETTVNGYNGDYCPTWDLIEAVEEKLKQKNGYAEEKNT